MSSMLKNRWSFLFSRQTSKLAKIRMIPRYHRFVPPEYRSIMFKVMASGVEPDSTSAAATLWTSPGTHTPPQNRYTPNPPGSRIQLVKAHWSVQTPKGRRISSASTGRDLEAVAGPDVGRLRGACQVHGVHSTASAHGARLSSPRRFSPDAQRLW